MTTPIVLGSWYDVEWTQCPRCGGDGQHVECYDDLFHTRDHCTHGDNLCALCEGVGRITKTLDERWFSRDTFEAVTATAADLRVRGKLHAAAREYRNDPDKSLQEAEF
jgi:hypothetical protein